MKCPKCGSRLVLSAEKNINKCTKCLMKEYHEVKHQQRLDKVLSKFEEVSLSGNPPTESLSKTLYEDNMIKESLIYIDKKFYKHVKCLTVIADIITPFSLDTVESLLEDLEVK